MAQQYIPLKSIMGLLLINPLLNDLTYDIIVTNTLDFMRIVGTPGIFETKVIELEVKNYRAFLPDDFYQLNTVEYHNTCIPESAAFNVESQYPQFKVQGDYIYFTFEDGKVVLSYQAIPQDENNNLLIPNNSSFTRALIDYIKFQHYTILFELSKIPAAVYNNIQLLYAWSVGDCQAEFNRWNMTQAESYVNLAHSIINRYNQFETGYKNQSIKKEILKH